MHAPDPHPGVAAVRAELPGVLDAIGAGAAPGSRRRAAPSPSTPAAPPTRRPPSRRCANPLAELAARHGLIVEPGRLVLELRPPGMDKGVALAEYVREVGAEAVLYAGDDLGDLAAFAAVEKLRSEGVAGPAGVQRQHRGRRARRPGRPGGGRPGRQSVALLTGDHGQLRRTATHAG